MVVLYKSVEPLEKNAVIGDARACERVKDNIENAPVIIKLYLTIL